jgi:hypothetical protein
MMPRVSALSVANRSRWCPARSPHMAGPTTELECRQRAATFMAAVAIKSAAAAVIMDDIAAPFMRRAQAGRPPSSSAIAHASREWVRLVPEAGRIAPLAIRKNKARRELLIRDTRLFSGSVQLPGVGELPRRTVAVVLTELDIKPLRVAFQSFPAIVVQGHAIARWYQRSFDVSDDVLRSDLAALARRYPEAVRVAEANPDRSLNLDGWRAACYWQHGASVQPSLTLLVRTYAPPEMARAAT